MPRRLRIGYGASSRTLTADQGTFTLTGVAAGLVRQLKLVAAQGALSLTGQAATLTYSGSSPSLTALPSSPIFTAEGTSAAGQVTLNWLLPETLMDGTAVSTAPLTSLTIYHNTTATGAAPGQSGVTTISGITATDVSRVVSFAASTRYFAISATNANGEGSLSPAVKGIST